MLNSPQLLGPEDFITKFTTPTTVRIMSQIKPVNALATHFFFFKFHFNNIRLIMSFLLPSDAPNKFHTHFASLRAARYPATDLFLGLAEDNAGSGNIHDD